MSETTDSVSVSEAFATLVAALRSQASDAANEGDITAMLRSANFLKVLKVTAEQWDGGAPMPKMERGGNKPGRKSKVPQSAMDAVEGAEASEQDEFDAPPGSSGRGRRNV